MKIETYEDACCVLSRISSVSDVLSPAAYLRCAAALVFRPNWVAFFQVFEDLSGADKPIMNWVFGHWPNFSSECVRNYAQDMRTFVIGDSTWVLGRIGSHPVIWAQHFANAYVWAPVREKELLAELVEGPTILTPSEERSGLGIACDEEPPPLLDPQTQEIISLTQRTPGPRSWLLYGPPGGSKTTAARQIARVIGDGAWVLLDPQALDSYPVWQLVHKLKPRALVLDEVDSAAPRGLLVNLTRARQYAKVIVQTANVVDGLRGALKRTGRTDERPRLYNHCNLATARMCAPTVPHAVLDEAVTRGLLHSYFAELEVRHLGGRDLDEALEELLERQAENGAR